MFALLEGHPADNLVHGFDKEADLKLVQHPGSEFSSGS